MTEQATTFALGSPAWMDLGTHDLEGARAFYGELFGWTFDDQGEEFGHYHLVSAGDALIGGMMSTAGMTCPEGGAVPTQWGIYLTVHDVESAVTRATEAGGTVAIPPMPVGDLGSMAVLIDPSGADVGLWQPGTLAGFDLPTTPGTPVWFELMTKDFDAALTFYSDALGWDVHWMSGGGQRPQDGSGAGDGEWRYVTHGAGDGAVAGLGDAAGVFDQDAPSAWRIYLRTADVESDLVRIPSLGGDILDGPVDSPFGRVATVRDPQGATFQLIQTMDER